MTANVDMVEPTTAQLAVPRRADWLRPLAFGLTVAILIAAAVIAITVYGATARLGKLGVDMQAVTMFAQRWLDSGSMYTPAQLSGPFDQQPEEAVAWLALPSMYPPTAVFLFLPFLWLPTILWWAIPIGILAYTIVRWRPSMGAWPAMAAMLLFPATWANLWVGNTTVWIAAFVAAGLTWGGPGVLVLLKPTLAPFALVGIRHRSWRVALVVWCVLAVVMAPAWLDYLSVVRNAVGGSVLYSVASLPTLMIPLIAWAGQVKRIQSNSASLSMAVFVGRT